MRNTSTRGRLTLLFMMFAMMLALPAMVLADTLQINNTLVVGSNVSKDPGQSGTGKVWLATDDNNIDTRNGCNATATAPVTVTFTSSDTNKIANPAPVRLTDCGTDHAADFSYNVASSATAGTVQIKGAVSGGRGGTYTTTDTLTVTINAPAKQDTAISNVSGNGTYGDDASVTAKLSSGTNNLSGKTVAFELNGRAVGTDATDANGVAELSDVSLSGIDAGTHNAAVSANFTGDSSYNGSSRAGNLTVDKAATATTVSCDAGPFTYDGSAQEPCSASVSGPGGLDQALPVDYQGNVNAGQATAGASYAGSGNHQPSSGSKNFSIAKANAVIDVRGFDGAYDGTAKGASGTAKGADGSNLNSLLDLGARFTDVPGGTANWSFAGDANHKAAGGSVAISIAKAKATINLSGLSKTYNGSPQGATADTTPDVPNKQLTVTYDGGGTQAPTDAGSYRVVASLSDASYEATDATGTLTIAQKALSVTANDDRREYGDPNPALTGVLSGDVAADNISASYATAATKASDVGAYPVVPSLNDPNNRLSNYEVARTNGTLTVTKATLRATAADADKVYGDALSASDLTGSFTGVKNGDPVTVSYSSAGAPATSDVGAYPIVPSLDATAAVLANYHDPILTNGTLRVTKAPLVIKANDASRFYGDQNPVFTGSVVSGVKNDDVLNLSFTTTALQSSPVGTYAIVPEASGAKVGNYLVSAQNGTLTIGSWTFKGFYQPVDMSGTLNTVKGGSTVPIKFELFKGATELTDTASITQPLRATKVACDTGATVDEIELLATGSTSLRYDATAGQFVYNWKTPTGAGSCYKVTITANDGSSQTAHFRLK